MHIHLKFILQTVSFKSSHSSLIAFSLSHSYPPLFPLPSYLFLMSCYLFSIPLVTVCSVCLCCVCAGQEEVPTIAAVYSGAAAPVNTGISLPSNRHTSSDVHINSVNTSVTHPRFPEK